MPSVQSDNTNRFRKRFDGQFFNIILSHAFNKTMITSTKGD